MKSFKHYMEQVEYSEGYDPNSKEDLQGYLKDLMDGVRPNSLPCYLGFFHPELLKDIGFTIDIAVCVAIKNKIPKVEKAIEGIKEIIKNNPDAKNTVLQEIRTVAKEEEVDFAKILASGQKPKPPKKEEEIDFVKMLGEPEPEPKKSETPEEKRKREEEYRKREEEYRTNRMKAAALKRRVPA